MGMIDELKDMGVATEEGLDRVMGDTDLYEMMLGMFVDTVRDNPVQMEEFAGGGDLEPLIKRVHTLKGVTGNLAMTPLFESYTKVLGLLRENKPQEAKAGYEQLLPKQGEILDCIKRHNG